MNDTDKTIEKLEQSNAWDDADEVVRMEFKKPLDKVIPVRLSSEKWEELRQEAKELGIGPTTLARMWILKALRSEVKDKGTSTGMRTEREVNAYGIVREKKSGATYDQGQSAASGSKIFHSVRADVPISKLGSVSHDLKKKAPAKEKTDRKG